MNIATRPDPFFIADNHALDLLNSIAAPNGSDIEWISNGHDLLSWLVKGKIVTEQEIKQFHSAHLQTDLDLVANDVRDLREWLREFVHKHAGKALKKTVLKELNTINTMLEKSNHYKKIEPKEPVSTEINRNNRILHCQSYRRWHSVDDLLLVVAETISDLICSVDFSLIKNCEGPTCTLWFYDISKNHSRRWCTMTICGNRAKAALHRAKKRSSKNKSR